MDPWRILQHEGRYTKCDDRGSQIARRGVCILGFLFYWLFVLFPTIMQ